MRKKVRGLTLTEVCVLLAIGLMLMLTVAVAVHVSREVEKMETSAVGTSLARGAGFAPFARARLLPQSELAKDEADLCIPLNCAVRLSSRDGRR